MAKKAKGVIPGAKKLPTLKDLKVPKGGLLNPALRKGVGKLPKKMKGI